MRKLVPLIVLGSSAAAFGHGVQVQATFNPSTGKIETRQVVTSTLTSSTAEPVPAGFPLGNTVADPGRVFVMPIEFGAIAAGNGWYTRPTSVLRGDIPVPAYPSGPGLTFRYVYQANSASSGWDWSNASNPATDPSLPNLAGTNFSYKLIDGLKQWNGSAWVDPGAEQLQIFRGDGTGAFTGTTVNAITSDSATDAAPVTMSLSGISSTTKPGATSVPHSSVSFRLLGDGASPAVEADNGIYLLSLRYTSTATIGTTGTPVADSDPFYFVMDKSGGFGNAISAANALAAANGIPLSQVQVIPEPASLGVLAVVGAAFARRRRM